MIVMGCLLFTGQNFNIRTSKDDFKQSQKWVGHKMKANVLCGYSKKKQEGGGEVSWKGSNMARSMTPSTMFFFKVYIWLYFHSSAKKKKKASICLTIQYGSSYFSLGMCKTYWFRSRLYWIASWSHSGYLLWQNVQGYQICSCHVDPSCMNHTHKQRCGV